MTLRSLSASRGHARKRLCAAVAAAAVIASGSTSALTFSQALEAARAHDPTYRVAGHELDATQLNVPIARASLLPLVTLNASDAKVVGSRRFPNAQNQEVRTPLDYESPQTSLGMRVPLFNFEALSAYKQAQAQSEVAESVFRSQGMDLMERLATAYLQVLLADDGRRLAAAQVTVFESQAAQAEQRQQRGEGTRVQATQARATLDVARTRLLETIDQVDLARVRLERLTGLANVQPSSLPALVKAEPLLPDRLGDWIDMAVRQSPLLEARERNREVARQAVRRQTAGHLPRLDLVASLARNQNDSTNAIGQSTALRSVGVQLSVPIFSGGGVDAGVRQALSRQALADEELRAERDLLEVDVQRHYLATVSGEKRIEAYQQATESTALAALGARRALETGLGTIAELADAQSLNFTAARDLAQARIDALLSRVRLMMRAGVPTYEIATEVDRLMLATPRASTTTGQR
ncbi:MAG: TolC family protein [Chitinophagaceae bacterium]|nr:TolC family protein [Rubrivivax sp.]